MAAQSMPARDAFMTSLAVDDDVVNDENFARAVVCDVHRYVSASERVLRVVDDVYRKHHLYVDVTES